MEIPIYHINAFTDELFSGNPASVCLLPKWLPDFLLTSMAKENNLPATAFLVRGKNVFSTRWITPEYELDICGHGTLASGFVIFNWIEPTWKKVTIQSPLEKFEVQREGDFITLNFPAKSLENYSSMEMLTEGLGQKPLYAFQHKKERILAVFANAAEVQQLQPNMQLLKKLEHRGVIVTAPGKNVDFVSRTFYPKKTISEDAATGSSHCLLVPYWHEQLGKKELSARQVSPRGGSMVCKYANDRVFISGKAVLYMQGKIILAED